MCQCSQSLKVWSGDVSGTEQRFLTPRELETHAREFAPRELTLSAIHLASSRFCPLGSPFMTFKRKRLFCSLLRQLYSHTFILLSRAKPPVLVFNKLTAFVFIVSVLAVQAPLKVLLFCWGMPHHSWFKLCSHGQQQFHCVSESDLPPLTLKIDKWSEVSLI